MTLFTDTDDVSGLLPEDFGPLIVRPVEAASIAIQVSDVVTTGNHSYKIPIVAEDTTASWVDEGEDLAGPDPVFDELDVVPSKVGRMIGISRELADDSTPSAQEEVGKSIARAIANQIDRAYFGDLASPAPAGLGSLDITVSEVFAMSAEWENTDPFAEAIALSDSFGGTIGSFVANPVDYLALMKLKRQDGSNEPLLGLDATAPTRRFLLGVKLLSSKHVTLGTIWGIPQDFSKVVMRDDVTVEVSRDYYFGTDQVAVKGTMRVGFGFPHPKSLVRIELGDS
jgi:HK97 family phage major capsid protein